MPASSVDVRSFVDGDEQAVLDLFARSFPHAPRGLPHFDWKYRRSPFGNRRISLAFDQDQRLVGHYAGYPVPFVIEGRTVFAHQIGDTMTDAGVRHIGRGPSSVLGRTALDFYARFCEGQIAFNYGFNVANIQKFSLRFLRSDRVEPVTFRTRGPLAPLKRFERWARGYQFELVRHTDAAWDDLFARASPAYRFLIRRDAEYVRWRYLACPDVRYHVIAIRKWRQLVGWIVYRLEGDRFLWGDAFVHPAFPDAIEAALRHVVPAHHVRVMEAWFPPRPAFFDRLLLELGFVSTPEPQNLSLMCVPFAWTTVVEQMRNDLYYTWGDGDLF
jgi:hypothetical protein